jgi:hypothetical protein
MAIGIINGSAVHGGPGSPIGVFQQTPTADPNFQTSVWGTTIPISGGYRMIVGAPIWAGTPFKANIRTQVDPVPPGFPPGSDTPTYTSWEIHRSFAVAVGFKLDPNATPSVRRVWADGTLIWSSNGDSAPLAFGNVTQDYLPQGIWVDGVWIPNPGSDPNAPPGSNGGISPGPVSPIKSNLTFRFYPGSEDQVPDSAIAAELGAIAPAYRGLMYLVIDGLAIGKGFAQSGSTINAESTTVVPGFPLINVELTDVNDTVVRIEDVKMLPGAHTLRAGATIMTDWVNREAVFITRLDAGGGWLDTFDLDSATQTSHLPITGMADPAEGVGPDEGLAMWDKVNQIIYTYGSGGTTENIFIAVDRSGAVVSESIANHFSPDNVDGSGDPTNWTQAKPAIRFPRCLQGDLTYLVQAGNLQTVFFAGNANWCAAVTPNDGVIPAGLEGISVFQSGFTISSILAYPTYQDALANRTQYQDAAFLFCQAETGIATHPPTCSMVFVSNVLRGPVSTAKILGSQLVHTGQNANCVLRAMVDNAGNILIEERDAGTGLIVVYRYTCTMSGTPDFTNAPGWRGRFPVVGALTVDAKTTGEDGNPWSGISIINSDLSQGTFSGGGHVILDINNLTVTDPNFTQPVGNQPTAWDSTTGTRWFTGSQDSGFGTGLRFIQAVSGLNGEVATVRDWVKDIAEYVGVDPSDIDVGTDIKGGVPGVVITKPYDLTALYNDIGALYDFSYFNSGGKLRFASSSNSPVKATGTFTITASGTSGGLSNNISDGSTLTIGSFVYRFKTTPSAPFDVKISLDTSTTQLDAREKTLQNFLAALAANLSIAALDSQDPLNHPGFFAGTVKNSIVTGKLGPTVSAWGSVAAILTAVTGGTAANSTTMARTGSGTTVTNLTGGAEPPEPSFTIDKGQLAYVEEDVIAQYDALVTTIAPYGQSQQSAQVLYYALEQNYLLTSQTYIPDDQAGTQITGTNAQVTYDLPFVISTSDAYARVAQTAFKQADNVVVQEFRLPQAFMLVEPSDIVAVHISPYRYLLRIDEATLNGDFSTSFSAVNYSYRTDFAVADSDATGTLPQTVATASDAIPLAMDLPTLDPRQATVVGSFDLLDGVRAYRSPFSFATLSAGKVVAGAADPVLLWSTSTDVKWATASVPAAVEPYYRTVEDTIVLSLKTMTTSDFAAADDYQSFVAGQNCLAYGSDATGWELIYFRDVAVVNEKQVALTGLIRAQRGTDAFVSHGASDVAVLISSASPTFTNVLRTQSMTSDEHGNTIRYIAAGLPTQRGPVSEDVDVKGHQIYPFSPCHLLAAAGTSNARNLSWVRRDRKNVEYVTNPASMSEASELYDLEILSGSTVVRTVTDLATPAYVYVSADQVTDGFTPPMATVKFRVYQKGELGRGFPREETVNVS